MNSAEFLIWIRAIFRKVKEIKALRGGVHRYAAPFCRTAEWDRFWLPEGRGPRMARVTSKAADWRRDCGKGPFPDRNQL